MNSLQAHKFHNTSGATTPLASAAVKRGAIWLNRYALSGCESIEFYNWETRARTKDLEEIQSEQAEILSIEQQGDIAHILCSTGELNVLYKDIEFQLDSGESVTYKELIDACNKYWDDWGSRKDS